MNKEAKILIGVGLIIVLGGWSLARFSPKTTPFVAPEDVGKLVRDDSHMTGQKNAKVTLVEFGDFQCPACAASWPVIEKIINDYKGNPNFNFVTRNFPLTEIHDYAMISAEAAEAAGAQGKYWEMFEILYENQVEWVVPQSKNFLIGYAQRLGLDVTQFEKALTEKTYVNFVKTDRADGEALKITSTPSFFLNGEKMVGVPNYDALKAKIEEKLK